MDKIRRTLSQPHCESVGHSGKVSRHKLSLTECLIFDSQCTMFNVRTIVKPMKYLSQYNSLLF